MLVDEKYFTVHISRICGFMAEIKIIRVNSSVISN